MGILEHLKMLKNNAQKRREALKPLGSISVHIMDMAASKFYQVVHPRPISLFQSLFKNGLSLVQGSSSFSYENFHVDPFWGIQISHFQPHTWCCSCAYLRHQLRRLRQLRRQYHSIEVPPVVAQAQLLGSDFSHWRAQMNGQAFLEGVKLQHCFLIHH